MLNFRFSSPSILDSTRFDSICFAPRRFSRRRLAEGRSSAPGLPIPERRPDDGHFLAADRSALVCFRCPTSGRPRARSPRARPHGQQQPRRRLTSACCAAGRARAGACLLWWRKTSSSLLFSAKKRRGGEIFAQKRARPPASGRPPLELRWMPLVQWRPVSRPPINRRLCQCWPSSAPRSERCRQLSSRGAHAERPAARAMRPLRAAP